jgi:hypothetical protein
MIAAIVVLVVLGLIASHHHGRHYQRNRSRGLNMWVSMRGPFGTRISKRL